MATRNRLGSIRQIDFLVLAVLTDGPLHGYGIVQALARMSDGRIEMRPGDVYRVLYRMHRAGLIEPADAAEVEDADDRRSYYRITREGSEAAAEQAELMAGVAAQLLARARR